MHNGLVTIVIPCFNQGSFLLETLASVAAQTFQEIETVVVDDGSDDPETCSVLEALERQGAVLVRTARQGLAAARNLGISKGSGEFVLPLDADDKIAPSYVEKAVAALRDDPALGIVYCQAEFFGDETGVWDLPPYSFPEILLGNRIFASAMFRRHAFEQTSGYDPGMVHGWEDWDLWLSLIARGAGVYRIPEVLFQYRRHRSSMTRRFTHDQKADMFARIFARHQALYESNIRAVLGEFLRLQQDLEASQRDRDELLRYAHRLENHAVALEAALTKGSS